MEFLNNANTVAGLIASLIAIVTAIFVGIGKLRKIISSQQQTIQIQSSQKQSSYQTVSSLSLNWMDWLLVLWLGLEDSLRAKGGMGWAYAGMIIGFGGAVIFKFSLFIFILFLGLSISVLILFYVYFVGRRIEELLKDKNKTTPTRKSKRSSATKP